MDKRENKIYEDNQKNSKNDNLYVNKYVIYTDYNDDGKLVFSNFGTKKDARYLLKDDDGKFYLANKDWIIENNELIVNLKLSGRKKYPANQLKRNNLKSTSIYCSCCGETKEVDCVYTYETPYNTISICPNCYKDILEDKRKVFYGEIKYTMDKEHCDCKYINNWTEDYVDSYNDIFKFDGDNGDDYCKEIILEHLVDGLNDYEHSYNFNFTIERLRI